MFPIYDYYGLHVYFKSNNGLPITIYGKRNEQESACQLCFENGLIQGPVLLTSENELDEDDKSVFLLLIENNSSEIIKHWLDIFLYKKPVQAEIIKSKIKP